MIEPERRAHHGPRKHPSSSSPPTATPAVPPDAWVGPRVHDGDVEGASAEVDGNPTPA
jgi:hypothetical protein